jgi:nucleotide-binding universal stress UspA family protein
MTEAMMKNILLLVHDDTGQEARLQAALDITRALDGHLNCLDVAMMPTVAGDLWVGGGAAVYLPDETETEAVNRAKVEKRLDVEGLAWTWTDAVGDISHCLERAAVLNDLIVLNRQLDGFHYPDMRMAASELVVRTGKPILAVPPAATGFATAGRAIVAWDGSPPSDAALRAALPLLRLASHVTVLEIDDGSVDIPAEEAAAYLSRHDIHPLVVRERSSSGEAGDGLLHAIRQRQADYLVMGGFSHSRAAEALFGGVTRTLLTKSPVPLLLAH